MTSDNRAAGSVDVIPKSRPSEKLGTHSIGSCIMSAGSLYLLS